MGMSVWYGLRDETESIATLHRALEAIVAAPCHQPFRNGSWTWPSVGRSPPPELVRGNPA
jgi:hypothetical protein